jgi:Mor family transcriptional regulator
VTEKHIAKTERNDQICARYAAGESLESISASVELSVQRVHQIIRRWCA